MLPTLKSFKETSGCFEHQTPDILNIFHVFDSVWLPVLVGTSKELEMCTAFSNLEL